VALGKGKLGIGNPGLINQAGGILWKYAGKVEKKKKKKKKKEKGKKRKKKKKKKKKKKRTKSMTGSCIGSPIDAKTEMKKPEVSLTVQTQLQNSCKEILTIWRVVGEKED